MKSLHSISIGKSLLWVAGYFFVMVLYTGIDMGVWRNMEEPFSNWFHLLTMILLSAAYLWLLTKKTSFQLNLFRNVTATGVLFSIFCSFLFYFLMDNCLDPLFESLFPMSEAAYQDSVSRLLKTPVTTFLHVCLLAPFAEEMLMRGFVLGGLKNSTSSVFALFTSSILFALLHFNMVQTLSALVCGIILGILYLKTDSILCCILAHCGYNAISYFAEILNVYGRME